MQRAKRIYVALCMGALLGVTSAAWSQAANSAAADKTVSIDNYPTYGTWHSSRIRGGGYFQNVIISASNPQRCYTYVDMAGMYRSDDGGNTWRMLHGNLPQSHALMDARGIDVDPRNADCFVAALGQPNTPDESGVYRTTDGGKSFTRVLPGLFGGNSPHREAGQVIARSPHNPDVIIAATFGTGAWRSEDNGVTWTDCGVRDRWASDVHFDKSDPNRVFLCSQPYKGHLGKEQKTLTEAFYRSMDGGRTWQKLSDQSPSEMLQDPNDPARFFGIFDYRVVSVTSDYGDTWQPLTDGLPVVDKLPKDWPYVSPHKFTVLAAGPDFVVTGNANGDFWRLNRNQTRWSPVVKKSVEAGDWWGNSGSRKGYVHYGKARGSLVIDPRNPNHWYATDWFAIWQSYDAGQNWKLTVDGAEPTYIFALAADPTSPSIVHMGMSDNGYFRSTDGGKSFYQNTNGISSDIKDVEVCLSNPRHLYAVGGSLTGNVIKWGINQVYTSVDAGQSWQASPQQGLPDSKIFRWNTVIADPKNENHVLLAVSGKPVAGAGGVYESHDGGASWAWMGEGLPTDKEFFRDSIWTIGRELAIDGNGGMIAMSSDRRVAYRFDQQSRQWTKSLDLHGMPMEVAANPQQPGVFLVSTTADGVFLTNDGGKNWQLTFKGRAGRVGWDAVGGKRAAVSTGDSMILSNDGGKTWEKMDQNLPERRLHNMSAFTGNRLIVGSGASGVFWTDLKP